MCMSVGGISWHWATPPTDLSPIRPSMRRGMVVAPGLIDMQARLREPGEDHTGSMESELAAAVVAA
jgi:dihydroorotase